MKLIGNYKITFVTCFVIALSIYVALYGVEFGNVVFRFWKDSPENRTGGRVSVKSPFDEDVSSFYMSIAEEYDDRSYSLQSDFYRQSCPSAERIGCDASVLLDSNGSITSEKEASPNLSLKGFEVIDTIKSELENVCPGVVSCADIIALAARESVKVAGGPRYDLETGRKDSVRVRAFKEAAERELPSPNVNLSVILARFASRGFDEQETVSLFGAHSIGITHCAFFENRLYNFSGTGNPDPELNPEFLQELKTRCPFSAFASSPSPSLCTGLAPSFPASDCSKNKCHNMSSGKKNDGVIDLSFNNEGGDVFFGIRYYRRLMERKGVMFSDQQLTGSKETEKWVRLYASNPITFRRHFAMTMIKLSTHRVLTGNLGQVRRV